MENKKLGFLILSAAPVDVQFIALLDKLFLFKMSSIVVHHDSIQGGVFPVEIIQKYNITLVQPEYRTYWSHLNNVLATIDGLQVLYDLALDIDWFLTITPTCYPIKPIGVIQEFYDNCEFDALIDMHQVGHSDHFRELDSFLLRDFTHQPCCKLPFLSKDLKFYWRTFRKKLNINPHPFLDIRIPFQGSNWLSINRRIVKHIIDADLKNGDLVSFYKNNVVANPDMHPCPQETILPTFIGNLVDVKILHDNYRYINWAGSTDWSPNILTMSHLDDIIKCKAHWARKFNDGASAQLLKNINFELL